MSNLLAPAGFCSSVALAPLRGALGPLRTQFSRRRPQVRIEFPLDRAVLGCSKTTYLCAPAML